MELLTDGQPSAPPLSDNFLHLAAKTNSISSLERVNLFFSVPGGKRSWPGVVTRRLKWWPLFGVIFYLVAMISICGHALIKQTIPDSLRRRLAEGDDEDNVVPSFRLDQLCLSWGGWTPTPAPASFEQRRASAEFVEEFFRELGNSDPMGRPAAFPESPGSAALRLRSAATSAGSHVMSDDDIDDEDQPGPGSWIEQALSPQQRAPSLQARPYEYYGASAASAASAAQRLAAHGVTEPPFVAHEDDGDSQPGRVWSFPPARAPQRPAPSIHAHLSGHYGTSGDSAASAGQHLPAPGVTGPPLVVIDDDDDEQPGPSWKSLSVPPPQQPAPSVQAAFYAPSAFEAQGSQAQQTQAEASASPGVLPSSGAGPAAPAPAPAPALLPERPPVGPLAQHPYVRLASLVPGFTPRPWVEAIDFGYRAMAQQEIFGGMRLLLLRPVLSPAETDNLMAFAEMLGRHAVLRLTNPLDRTAPYKMVKSLGLKFLTVNLLYSAFQVVGLPFPPWWFQVKDAILADCDVSPVAERRPQRVKKRPGGDILEKLRQALVKYRTGSTPAADEIIEVKRLLFCSSSSPEFFRSRRWDPWRDDAHESTSSYVS